jgi:hypothetical protein
MRIAVIFNLYRPDTIGIYFERAFRQLGHEVLQITPGRLTRLTTPCELYFRVDDGDYSSPPPNHLRPTVYWVSDTHLALKKIKPLSVQYDLVFCPMKEGVESLKRAGADVAWIPGGCCDPQIHKRFDRERDLDIGFVGTDGGVPRKFYLQELRERYPNSYIGHADYRKISDIYSRSKIGFSYAIRRETLTMRSLEIMACGALCLANPPKDDTLEAMGLRDRRHLVLYRSPRELFQLSAYYLSHPQERTIIAEEGYKASVGRLTYRRQSAQMLEIIIKKGLLSKTKTA